MPSVSPVFLRCVRISLVVVVLSLPCSVSHRHPNTHSCPFEGHAISQPTKNKAAHALLAKLFPPASGATTKTPQSPSKPILNPKKAAQLRQVEAMKMRHRALPGDLKDKASSVSVTDRVHIKVHSDHKDMQEKILWFRKVISMVYLLTRCLCLRRCLRSPSAQARRWISAPLISASRLQILLCVIISQVVLEQS